MKKLFLFFSIASLVGTACFAASNSTDFITITTYYPAPYGVYKDLRIYPSTERPTKGVDRGLLIFNDTADGFEYYNASGWQTIKGGGYWAQNATNQHIYNVNPGGNVGIGTTNPRSKLEIAGTTDGGYPSSTASLDYYGYAGKARLIAGTNGALALTANLDSFRKAGEANGLRLDDATKPAWDIVMDPTNDRLEILRFAPQSGAFSAAANNVLLHMNNQGNVGIGTMAPQTRLHIVDNVSGDDQVIVQSQGAETGIGLKSTSGGRSWQLGVEGSPNQIPLGSFFIQDEVDSSTDVVVNPNGNVGIGATNPQAKLEVKGTIRGRLDCREVVGPWANIGVASCAADEYAISGGGQCNAPAEDGFLHYSGPTPDLSGWVVDCFSYNWQGDINSRAFAVCCKKD